MSTPPLTIEQAAYVLRHVADHVAEGGTFRYLIYDRLGFGPEAYTALYKAGGMDITNAIHDLLTYEATARSETERPL